MDFASTDIGICSCSNLANESIERARNALQRLSCCIRKPADSRHFGALFGDIVSRLKTRNKAINLSQPTSSLLGHLRNVLAYRYSKGFQEALDTCRMLKPTNGLPSGAIDDAHY